MGSQSRWTVLVFAVALLRADPRIVFAADLWRDGPRELKIAFILFNFSNAPNRPITADDLGSVVATTNAYFAAASSGLVSLAWDVVDWRTIPFDYDPDAYEAQLPEWRRAAAAAAEAAGEELDRYDVLFFVYAGSGCGTAASDGRRESWIDVGGCAPPWWLIAHELGHNLGLGDALSLMCENADGTPVSMGGACRYGRDGFTMMGGAGFGRQFTAYELTRLGVLSPAEFPAGSVQTVTCEGVYELAPAEVVMPGKVQLIRVPRVDGESLYLEVRQPRPPYDDFDAGDPAVNGVMIRVAPDAGGWPQPILVDTTPGSPSPSAFADAALGRGRTFVDPVSGTAITTSSVSPDGAVVRIAPGPCLPTYDADGDGVCDACDACTAAGPWRRARLALRGIDDGIADDDALSVRGSFRPVAPNVDAARDGVRVELRSGTRELRLDLVLPGSRADGAAQWTVDGGGARSVFRDATRGIRMRVTHRPDGWVDVALAIAHATLGVALDDAPLQATIAFGDGAATHDPGACGEVVFGSCRTDRERTALTCR